MFELQHQFATISNTHVHFEIFTRNIIFCGILYHTQRRHAISEDSEEEDGVSNRQNESNRRLIDDLNE
jgi:hypothetical protein